MLAADNWCVKVDERVYGPYSSIQLRKFAHEGRLAAWSLVAPAGSRSWREARSESTFSSFFGVDAPRGALNSSRTFGRKREEIQFDEAPMAKADNPVAAKKRKATTTRPERSPRTETSLANFVIIFDVVNAAASRVETAVLSLGPGFRVADNVWTVQCELTAIGVRNAISPYLLPRELIFVIDANRGRTSWQNFAPEIHAKLAAAWAAAK